MLAHLSTLQRAINEYTQTLTTCLYMSIGTYLSGLSPSPPSKDTYSSVNHSTISPPDKFDW